jgi:uncharacterized membrane protein
VSALAAVLAQAGKVLPPADKAAFIKVMKRDALKFEAPARELVAARQQVETHIAAETLDKDAVRRALAQWRIRGAPSLTLSRRA